MGLWPFLHSYLEYVSPASPRIRTQPPLELQVLPIAIFIFGVLLGYIIGLRTTKDYPITQAMRPAIPLPAMPEIPPSRRRSARLMEKQQQDTKRQTPTIRGQSPRPDHPIAGFRAMRVGIGLMPLESESETRRSRAGIARLPSYQRIDHFLYILIAHIFHPSVNLLSWFRPPPPGIIVDYGRVELFEPDNQDEEADQEDGQNALYPVANFRDSGSHDPESEGEDSSSHDPESEGEDSGSQRDSDQDSRPAESLPPPYKKIDPEPQPLVASRSIATINLPKQVDRISSDALELIPCIFFNPVTRPAIHSSENTTFIPPPPKQQVIHSIRSAALNASSYFFMPLFMRRAMQIWESSDKDNDAFERTLQKNWEYAGYQYNQLYNETTGAVLNYTSIARADWADVSQEVFVGWLRTVNFKLPFLIAALELCEPSDDDMLFLTSYPEGALQNAIPLAAIPHTLPPTINRILDEYRHRLLNMHRPSAETLIEPCRVISDCASSSSDTRYSGLRPVCSLFAQDVVDVEMQSSVDLVIDGLLQWAISVDGEEPRDPPDGRELPRIISLLMVLAKTKLAISRMMVAAENIRWYAEEEIEVERSNRRIWSWRPWREERVIDYSSIQALADLESTLDRQLRDAVEGVVRISRICRQVIAFEAFLVNLKTPAAWIFNDSDVNTGGLRSHDEGGNVFLRKMTHPHAQARALRSTLDDLLHSEQVSKGYFYWYIDGENWPVPNYHLLPRKCTRGNMEGEEVDSIEM
ncbi:hypothetical protein G7046_g5383 [Stylonectria norvegica]|nr:hypothetical protein G7046_g5383 [Stylonectria norvegica]